MRARERERILGPGGNGIMISGRKGKKKICGRLGAGKTNVKEKVRDKRRRKITSQRWQASEAVERIAPRFPVKNPRNSSRQSQLKVWHERVCVALNGEQCGQEDGERKSRRQNQEKPWEKKPRKGKKRSRWWGAISKAKKKVKCGGKERHRLREFVGR